MYLYLYGYRSCSGLGLAHSIGSRPAAVVVHQPYRSLYLSTALSMGPRMYSMRSVAPIARVPAGRGPFTLPTRQPCRALSLAQQDTVWLASDYGIICSSFSLDSAYKFLSSLDNLFYLRLVSEACYAASTGITVELLRGLSTVLSISLRRQHKSGGKVD